MPPETPTDFQAQPEPIPAQMPKKRNITLWALVALLIVVLIGVVAYMVWMKPSAPVETRTGLTSEEVAARLAALAGTSTPPTGAEVGASLKTLSGDAPALSSEEVAAKLKALQ